MNSLKARLTFSALLVILLILPVIGITLNNAFESHIKTSIKNELIAYSYSILAVTEIENKHIIMPEQLLENRFNVIDSGLYALIQKSTSNNQNTGDDNLWLSSSALTLESTIYKTLNRPNVGETSFYEVLNDTKQYFVYTITVSFNEGSHPLGITLSILIDQTDLDKNPRKLTPRECAQLQGFPQDYIVDAVSLGQIYKQFGNSVCMKVIDAVADQMVDTLANAEEMIKAKRDVA